MMLSRWYVLIKVKAIKKVKLVINGRYCLPNYKIRYLQGNILRIAGTSMTDMKTEVVSFLKELISENLKKENLITFNQ